MSSDSVESYAIPGISSHDHGNCELCDALEAAHAQDQREVTQLRLDDLKREVERLTVLYNELLYAVSQKHEGETRHQTALRYIQQQESRSASGQDAPKRAEGE